MDFTNKKLRKYVGLSSLAVIFILWVTVYNVDNPIPSFKHQPQQLITSPQELCTIESFNEGQWVYQPTLLDKPSFTESDIAKEAGYHCLKKFAHRCFRKGGEHLQRAKQIMDYRWKPDNCQVLDMDIKRLANHFEKNPILFVGDSITQLQFESLGCLLGGHFPNRHPNNTSLNGGNVKIKPDQRAPEDKDEVAMAYIRSDYLLRLDDFELIKPFDAEGTQLGQGKNLPWVHALDKFSYVVINTGPHWHVNEIWGPNNSEDELLAAFEDAMSQVLHYLDQHVRPDQRVWIRSTPFGHAGCSRFTEPQIHPLAPSGKQGEYDWHLFSKFDSVWERLLSSYQDDSRFSQFDINTLTNQRADAHSKPDIDCLHTCIPGPVDEWNRLLYHEIMKNTL